MNQEFSFETIPFEIDPEFLDEMFEEENERGKARVYPKSKYGFRSPSTVGHPPGRSPTFSSVRPKKPPVRKPSPNGFRPREPWRVIREPYALTSEPYSSEPEPPGSERVRWVQDCLNQVLGLQLPLNGVMGVETRSAVRSFQRQQKLPVRGIVGPDTEEALKRMCSGAAPSASNTFEASFDEIDSLETFDNEASELRELFVPTSPPIRESELSFGSPLRTARKVRANFVYCSPSKPAVKAITRTNNPVATIQAANTRAIELLDYVIGDLQSTRKKIVAGASGWPTISDALGQALKDRFKMDANNRTIWTSKGSRSVHVLIYRIRGARQILADGGMKYICLGDDTTINLKGCVPGRCVDAHGVAARALACGGNPRIVLCKPWWQDETPPLNRLDSQARTLLHECFHIYFERIGDTGNLANAHCYDQFVLALNGLAVPEKWVGMCPNEL